MTVVLFLGQIDEYEMLEAVVRIMTVGLVIVMMYSSRITVWITVVLLIYNWVINEMWLLKLCLTIMMNKWRLINKWCSINYFEMFMRCCDWDVLRWLRCCYFEMFMRCCDWDVLRCILRCCSKHWIANVMSFIPED